MICLLLFGILRTIGIIKNQDFENTIFIGELSLDGKINRVNGVLPICIEAKRLGFKKVICSSENEKEGALVDGIDIIGVKTLKELIDHLNGYQNIKPAEREKFVIERKTFRYDFSDIKGQAFAKRALEISAAGGHNCLLIGTPGTGKTMLSRCMESIMPSLTFEEALEITKIQSVGGVLKNSIASQRPFRSPHHTITKNGLIGGGNPPKPGEISFSHLGVMYLDELLEFKREVLELLREPLEDGVINISRLGNTIAFPSNFILLASTNPCPCGYYGSKNKKCTCSETKRKNYISKLSGPLLDRFDMRIYISEVNYDDIKTSSGESSNEIRKRVERAREIQKNRYKNMNIYSNSELSNGDIEKYCDLEEEAKDVLNKSLDKLKLSTRSYFKIIKVARTIADLDESRTIQKKHVLEAMQYRRDNEL